MTTQADLAAASRTYQEALAAASLAEANARDTLQAGFANLQASTYVTQIGGWESTPATPWHAQAHAAAVAQQAFTAARQAALLERNLAQNQTRHDYALAREAAWETFLNDRTTQSATDALALQQSLENGDTWIDEGDGQSYWMPVETDADGNPLDRYANVTIDLPPA